jgi:hypothetical protein
MVPRSLRHGYRSSSRGEIAWIAGVALSDLFKVTRATHPRARLKTPLRRRCAYTSALMTVTRDSTRSGGWRGDRHADVSSSVA